MSESRLRVAIDARPLQKGFRDHAGRGIGRYAVEIVRALARRDDLTLELWFEPALPVPDDRVPSGAHVHRFPSLHLPMRDRISPQLSVPRGVRASRADVFHFLSHGDAPARMPRNAVVTIHDVILEIFGHMYPTARTLKYRLARTLEAWAIECARTIVADSNATREDLVRLHHVPADRVHVAHLGVDASFAPPGAAAVDAVRARHGLAGPFVLYVGGIDARKNVLMLLDAFARARTRGMSAGVPLVFAGRIDHAPELPALNERAAALGIADAVRWLGFVSDDELPALFAAAGVFAFPSLYEGFGLPPLEAMACGAAVVSSTGGSLAEVVGDAALVANPNDPAAFGAAIARVLADDSLAADLRERGRLRAATFTWDRCADDTVRAYRASLARAPRQDARS
ncbi:MAG: glycosyltransferase family 4 protein [Candidatus Eisenbacteria bacterium]|nr:glycosyltransferase family 4 protein [Candidatus Eisenbacteria bacterium]